MNYLIMISLAGLFLVSIGLFVLAGMKIVGKAGYHPALGLFILVPYLNVFLFLIFAFSRWPVYDNVNSDNAKHQKPLSKFFLAIIVLIGLLPFIALLVSVIMPSFTRFNNLAKDSLVKNTLYSMSVAAESYKDSNNSNYPESMQSLMKALPSYLPQDYCDKIISGYRYDCEMSSSGYVFSAIPISRSPLQAPVLRIETGGVLSR